MMTSGHRHWGFRQQVGSPPPRSGVQAWVVAACLSAVTACGMAGCTTGGPAAAGGPASTAGPAPAAAARPAAAEIATATGPEVTVYRDAGAAAPWLRLTNPNGDGAPLVLSVTSPPRGGWLQVQLPIRPNGSTGWVRASQVALSSTEDRVDVYLAAHRLVASDESRQLVETLVAVGKTATPTPGGRYYITELLRPPDPDGAYGPYAFGLSGYSANLRQFAGGPGEIGMHGTNQPQLLGHDVSHGCIRMSNAAVTKLAHLVPLGTPVYIHP
jgi:lipoprotein-anchoring transpeptidase ErfK/SrfK